MKIYIGILVVFTVFLGCKKPLSETSVTALAVPITGEKSSVVFITGYDTGHNTYYSNSKIYFKEKGMSVVDSLFSIEEIINWLGQHSDMQTEFDEIHVVSHSNAWSGMSLKTTAHGERISLETLRKAKRQQLLSTAPKGITSATKLIFHSCGLGENQDLMRELQQAFTGVTAPTIYASPFFNVFGGKFAGHYLAKPYYGFYPTAESPGPSQLSLEFKETYPQTEIDWFKAIKTRREAAVGQAYSYTFNIPVDWEFIFENASEIPKFEDTDALIDWISESPEMAEVLFKLNIPLEKYRWRTKIHGKKLKIKGKATVLCILAPILNNSDKQEYRNVQVDDRLIYVKL